MVRVKKGMVDDRREQFRDDSGGSLRCLTTARRSRRYSRRLVASVAASAYRSARPVPGREQHMRMVASRAVMTYARFRPEADLR